MGPTTSGAQASPKPLSTPDDSGPASLAPADVADGVRRDRARRLLEELRAVTPEAVAGLSEGQLRELTEFSLKLLSEAARIQRLCVSRRPSR